MTLRGGRLARLLRALLAELTPVQPSAAVGEALDRKLAGTGRFFDLKERFAAFVDLPPEEAESLLARLIGKEGWLPLPGAVGTIEVIPFRPGPRHKKSHAVLLRSAPGARHAHTHEATERVFFLQGAIRNEDGSVFKRGEETCAAPGTAHCPEAIGHLECLCVIIKTWPKDG